jgi:hypothetical protein
MTDRTTLLALAERCEQAAGPDRELDAEIFVSVTQGMFFKGHLVGLIGSGVMYEADTYTASLDAALTLVLDGWRWWINSSSFARCWLVANDEIADKAQSEKCATPALAICAAALRARAAAHD